MSIAKIASGTLVQVGDKPNRVVSTSGTTVTRVSGDNFVPGSWAGAAVQINGVAYTVVDAANANTLTLTASAGTQTSVDMYGPTTTGPYTQIPEVTKVSGPSVKFDLPDVTSHDLSSNFRDYIPGLADGDSVSLEINWRPSNTVHAALRAASYARSLTKFRIVYPDTSLSTVVFLAFIANITPKADVGAVMTASINLKITGAPVWS